MSEEPTNGTGPKTSPTLDSFQHVALNVTPGDMLHRSVDDWTYPLRVYLVHELESTVLHDILTARYLDGEGFYDVD